MDEEQKEYLLVEVKLYEQLKHERKVLYALEAAGVDNWEGYDIAMENLTYDEEA